MADTTSDDSATKKTATKRTTKTSPTKKAAAKRGSAPRATAPKRATASQVAARAAQELLDLTGKGAEGVTGLERTDDGWKVQVEVVEVRRIPDTTDVLALYEVSTDERGGMEGYRRVRRYARGVPGDD